MPRLMLEEGRVEQEGLDDGSQCNGVLVEGSLPRPKDCRTESAAEEQRERDEGEEDGAGGDA